MKKMKPGWTLEMMEQQKKARRVAKESQRVEQVRHSQGNKGCGQMKEMSKEPWGEDQEGNQGQQERWIGART
jgi:hypothetical protein